MMNSGLQYTTCSTFRKRQSPPLQGTSLPAKIVICACIDWQTEEEPAPGNPRWGSYSS